MATPNYQFEKRRRELDKQKKKAEKLQRKQTHGTEPDADAPSEGSEIAPAPAPVDPAK